jgi:hypothetical protein
VNSVVFSLSLSFLYAIDCSNYLYFNQLRFLQKEWMLKLLF